MPTSAEDRLVLHRLHLINKGLAIVRIADAGFARQISARLALPFARVVVTELYVAARATRRGRTRSGLGGVFVVDRVEHLLNFAALLVRLPIGDLAFLAKAGRNINTNGPGAAPVFEGKLQR